MSLNITNALSLSAFQPARATALVAESKPLAGQIKTLEAPKAPEASAPSLRAETFAQDEDLQAADRVKAALRHQFGLTDGDMAAMSPEQRKGVEAFFETLKERHNWGEQPSGGLLDVWA